MVGPWFVWALIGVGCIGLEMVIPGFVIFFFGLGALATALCTLLPFVGAATWLQIILFILFSIASIVLLRKKCTKIFEGTVFDNKSAIFRSEDGIGEVVEVIEPVIPPTEGRIRFRGTTWKARSLSGSFEIGETARIVSRDNVTYTIENV